MLIEFWLDHSNYYASLGDELDYHLKMPIILPPLNLL